jgi:hypothetical protein
MKVGEKILSLKIIQKVSEKTELKSNTPQGGEEVSGASLPKVKWVCVEKK